MQCHVLTTRLPLTVLVSKFRDVDQLECQYLEITEKSSEIEYETEYPLVR